MKAHWDAINKADKASLFKKLVVAGCSFGLFMMLGCASSKPSNTATRTGPSDVQEVHILTTPFAVNFDQVGGPDGFAVRVYMGNPQNVKPFEVTQGSLEILMFDGVASAAELGKIQPLRTWKYSARELKSYVRNTSIGVAYTFTPVWEKAVPEKGKITVIVCYTTPKGVKIFSAASSVAMPVGPPEPTPETPALETEQQK